MIRLNLSQITTKEVGKMKFKNLKVVETFLITCLLFTISGCQQKNEVEDHPSSASQAQITTEPDTKTEVDVMTEKLIGCLELTDEEKKSIFDLSTKILDMRGIDRQSESEFIQLTNSVNELLNKYTEDKLVANTPNIDEIKESFEKYRKIKNEDTSRPEITQSMTYDIIEGQEIVKNSEILGIEDAEFEKASKEVWEEIKKIFPSNVLKNIKYYNPFSTSKLEEGSATYGGFISKDQNGDCVIAVNVSLGMETIPYTFYHEYGHYLSLNDDQFIESTSMTDCALKSYYDLKLKDNAYLKNFFNKFYKYTYDDMIAGKDSYYFFLRHQNEFVSMYASTSLLEDFAESFACFMIDYKDEKGRGKVEFFENYPDFVQLKEVCLQLRESGGVTAKKLT